MEIFCNNALQNEAMPCNRKEGMAMIFQPCTIDIPHMGIDGTKWSVVACDQYTSQPEYWKRVEEFVGDAPSTLRMIIPEIYLDQPGLEGRIKAANQTMVKYLKESVLQTHVDSCIYVERRQDDGWVRRGLVMTVDLECFDYQKGAKNYIRPTEGTVLERIPPRVQVRRGAVLEVPHVMLLIDDERRQVIEGLTSRIEEMNKLYDVHLMEHGGRVAGYQLTKDIYRQTKKKLMGLIEEGYYREKYGEYSERPLLFAVGDGNHSLSAAKKCYEDLKHAIGEKAKESPIRYAMVEIVNLHETALKFEPIHRVVFDCDGEKLIAALKQRYQTKTEGEGQRFTYLLGGKEQNIVLQNPESQLAVGSLQRFLDDYLKENPGRVDYVHGDKVVRGLCQDRNTVGFLLPVIEKKELFRTILKDGALPRKTFSMGRPQDKRFYMECREMF